MKEAEGTGAMKIENTNDGVITVYVCACGSFYASSSIGNLEQEPIHAPAHAKDAGKIRHMRSRCPDCGKDRVRRTARLIPIPDEMEISKAVTAAIKSGKSHEEAVEAGVQARIKPR
jgi:ribosomal protein L37AE/L43A